MKLLSVEKLGFTFAGAEEKTLRNLSFCMRAGEFVLLTGETGGGKGRPPPLVSKILLSL